MSDIVDTLELMARNYAYAARKLTLFDASAEIQSLRMQNKALTKSLADAARRVRWLESLLYHAEYSDNSGEEYQPACPFCSRTVGHNERCDAFAGEGSIKPTPESFK